MRARLQATVMDWQRSPRTCTWRSWRMRMEWTALGIRSPKKTLCKTARHGDGLLRRPQDATGQAGSHQEELWRLLQRGRGAGKPREEARRSGLRPRKPVNRPRTATHSYRRPAVSGRTSAHGFRADPSEGCAAQRESGQHATAVIESNKNSPHRHHSHSRAQGARGRRESERQRGRRRINTPEGFEPSLGKHRERTWEAGGHAKCVCWSLKLEASPGTKPLPDAC